MQSSPTKPKQTNTQQSSPMNDPTVTNKPEMKLYLGMHMDEALVGFGAGLLSTRVVLQVGI